jgi:hypothetical protein
MGYGAGFKNNLKRTKRAVKYLKTIVKKLHSR